MYVEELAYTIDAIKEFNVSTDWEKMELNGTIGYLKNTSNVPLEFAVAPPRSFKVIEIWGKKGVSDTFLTIEPQEVIGPIYLYDCYLRANKPNSTMQIIVYGVRG